MVAEFWLDAVTGIAGTYGITPEAMLIVMAFMFSTGFGLFAIIEARAFGSEHAPDLGVATFFISLYFFTFIGAVDFIVTAIPTILMAAYYFFMHNDNG